MDARLHIAHVLLSLQPGGLENGVVNVVNGLDPARFRSTVLCLKLAGEFAQRITAPGTRVVEFGLKPGNDFGLPLRLARTLRRERVDLVHTRNAEPFFYGSIAARLAGRRLIHSEHGRTFDDRPARLRLQRWLTPWADVVFAVSQQLRLDLTHHVGIAPARIEVLYNGVNLERFAAVNRVQARQALGVPEGRLLVGSVGRLVPVKNYPLLVRAMQAPALQEAQLVLVGDGPQRGALEDLARSQGLQSRVRFMGHRDDVDALLGGLDLFVLPSFSEGMSNTLLEAMACGVAPVASAVGGNGEIVRAGQDGLLFASDDEPALRAALGSLAVDAGLRARLGRSARERVMAAFDIRVMLRNYEDLYDRVARNKGSPR